MVKINFENLPSTNTPLSASNLNTMQDNIEDAVNGKDISVQNVYSTTETIVGEWIDGKPLYRKVINVGNKPTDATINVSNAVSDLDTLVRISGTAYNATFNQYYNIPNTHDTIASWFINALIINKKVLQVRGGIGWNNAGGLTNIYVILEYTKTTD